jgi:hypothetical protein
VRRILQARKKPTERLVDTVNADVVGEDLVAANKLLPGTLRPRAYVFSSDLQRSGVLKVGGLASFRSAHLGIATVTAEVSGAVDLAVDPVVRFEVASGTDLRRWLAEEVADYCGTEGAEYVRALLAEAASGAAGDGWLGLLHGEPEHVESLLDESTRDADREALAPPGVDLHQIRTPEGRQTLRQVWTVVRVFGWPGVLDLAALDDQLRQSDPESLGRTTLELTDLGEVGRGEATELHLDEGQTQAFTLRAPLEAGASSAVAVRLTLVDRGPEDVPAGSSVISSPLIITVDGDRVTLDVGADDTITTARGDGMASARELAPL